MVDDDYLFRSVGFDSVESIDANNYEQATHILDFNEDVPDEFCERYDVIYEGGTLEHIFNLPQCLKNIYKMLKPGGIVIHALPSNNHVDHGFYQFSPTLFYDYYSSNNWTILRSNLTAFFNPDYTNKSMLVFDYKPGSIDHLTFGGWGKEMLGIWFVVKKTPGATYERISMQGSYVKAWAVKPGDEDTPEIQRKSYLILLKQIVKSNKYFYWIALRLYISYLQVFRKPKVIAKYRYSLICELYC